MYTCYCIVLWNQNREFVYVIYYKHTLQENSGILTDIPMENALQENTPNSDGGSDGHQGRRTFVTEYWQISDQIQKN